MTGLNTTRFAKSSLAAAAAMAVVSGASAAAITGTQDTSPTSGEVSTTGALVEAINLVGTDGAAGGTTSVNGVDFADTNLFGNGYNVGTSPSITGDAAIDALYAGFGYNGGLVTITGLTIGNTYELQAFYGDTRGCCGARTWGVGEDFAAAAANLEANPLSTGIIFNATFVADATTQTFASVQSANTAVSELSAYQVREVPEPGSLALLGLGGLMIARRRRG